MHKVSKYDINLFNNLLNNNNNDYVNSENICLITNEVLDNNHIKLSCQHNFNYEPLYNEVVYQKTRKLLDNSQLKINEIKCPYCRTITNKLLPFYKYYSVRSIRGVTYPEEYCMKIYECQHIKNGIKCTKTGCNTMNGIFCNKHLPTNKIEEDILTNENIDTFSYYKKKKVTELKNILRLNNYKISGNKKELIDRIIINRHKYPMDWKE